MMPDWASLKDRGGPWPEDVAYAYDPEFGLVLWNALTGKALYRGHQAALCRDAAVWWIESQVEEAISLIVIGPDEAAVYSAPAVHGGKPVLLGRGDSRDAALFNACVTLLDNSDAQSTTPAD